MYVVASEEHFDHLLELNRCYYPEGHPALDRNYFQWLCLQNPAGPANFVVAEEDGKWIGVIVLVPVWLANGCTPQKACFAVNVLSHPAHRGKNLFSRMIAHAKGELTAREMWLIGHPNANAVSGWKRQKMQFRSSLSVHLAKWAFPFSTFETRRLTCIENLPAELWDELDASASGIRMRITPEFVRWRYFSAPHRQYSIVSIGQNGRVLGIRITRKFRWPFDLFVDYFGNLAAAPTGALGGRRLTLCLGPVDSRSQTGLRRHMWALPVERELPFFVTTWRAEDGFDMSGITLSASDF
jgi:GNAT superfamily N-acetyltransferase